MKITTYNVYYCYDGDDPSERTGLEVLPEDRTPTREKLGEEVKLEYQLEAVNHIHCMQQLYKREDWGYYCPMDEYIAIKEGDRLYNPENEEFCEVLAVKDTYVLVEYPDIQGTPMFIYEAPEEWWYELIPCADD